MKSYITQMCVVVDFNLETDDIILKIMDGFVEIEKHDLRIAKVICNSQVKFNISQNVNCFDKENRFYGAEYVIDDSMKSQNLILISEDGQGDILKIISSQ